MCRGEHKYSERMKKCGCHIKIDPQRYAFMIGNHA